MEKGVYDRCKCRWWIDRSRTTISGEVILNDQECKGQCDFAAVPTTMTRHFMEHFGFDALPIAAKAIKLIWETYPKSADYLQTFQYHRWKDGTTTDFWAIHDGERVTFMLPEDY